MVFHSYVYESALLELFESTMKAHCAVCAPIPAHFRILKRQLDIVYVRSLHFYSFCRQKKWLKIASLFEYACSWCKKYNCLPCNKKN